MHSFINYLIGCILPDRRAYLTGFTSIKPIHYLLDYGDFQSVNIISKSVKPGGVIGLYFFKNVIIKNVINGERYRSMIINYFWPKLVAQNINDV